MKFSNNEILSRWRSYQTVVQIHLWYVREFLVIIDLIRHLLLTVIKLRKHIFLLLVVVQISRYLRNACLLFNNNNYCNMLVVYKKEVYVMIEKGICFTCLMWKYKRTALKYGFNTLLRGYFALVTEPLLRSEESWHCWRHSFLLFSAKWRNAVAVTFIAYYRDNIFAMNHFVETECVKKFQWWRFKVLGPSTTSNSHSVTEL